MKYKVQTPDGQYLTQTPDWFANFLTKNENEAKVFEEDAEFFETHYPSYKILQIHTAEESEFSDRNFRKALEEKAISLLAKKIGMGSGLVRKYIKGIATPADLIKKGILKKINDK